MARLAWHCHLAGLSVHRLPWAGLGEVRDALGEVNYWYLLPALALYFLGVWIRAIRWSALLRPVIAIGPRETFPIVIVGYMANNVLPLRTGELVRAYVLGRRYGVRKTTSLATIAIERLFDGLTMLAFMLSATAFVSFTSELRHLTLIAFVLFTGLLLGLVVLTLGRRLSRPATATGARPAACPASRPGRTDGRIVPERAGRLQA